MKLFDLGRVVITAAALEFCEEHDGLNFDQLLARHQRGDWGDMDSDDKKANDRAIQAGDRIVSGYDIGTEDDRIWIVTEADRSSTCILLPEDY